MQEIRNTGVGHHCVEDAVVGEKVAYQQQCNELRHGDGHHEQGAPELRAFGLFVIDEHGQQDAAEEVGKGCKERPDQRPGQHLDEGVAEGRGHTAAAKQREEVGQADPGEQVVRGHVLLVIVRKRDRNQDEQRHDGKYHNAQHRQGQQRDIELFVQVDVDVL